MSLSYIIKAADYYMEKYFNKYSSNYDEMLDPPRAGNDSDKSWNDCMKMHEDGKTIEEIRATDAYKNLSRLEKIKLKIELSEKKHLTYNPKYFGDE